MALKGIKSWNLKPESEEYFVPDFYFLAIASLF
jgi:hypothetical protein